MGMGESMAGGQLIIQEGSGLKVPAFPKLTLRHGMMRIPGAATWCSLVKAAPTLQEDVHETPREHDRCAAAALGFDTVARFGDSCKRDRQDLRVVSGRLLA
jgi:hypothetical protein